MTFNYEKDEHMIDIAFGEIIRRFRKGRNLSQEYFASLCGISTAYYGRIERGEYHVTLHLCHKISSALGIRLSDLFSDLPE